MFHYGKLTDFSVSGNTVSLHFAHFDGEVTVCGQGEDQWLEGAGTHPFTTRTEM